MGGVLGGKWLHAGAKPIFGKNYKKKVEKGWRTRIKPRTSIYITVTDTIELLVVLFHFLLVNIIIHSFGPVCH